MNSLKWDASKTAAENAKEKLTELAALFFSEGAVAANEETPIAAIHRFRLVTKRFRYTLELFADYYGPGLKRHIESLKGLQQLLGEVSDCSATQRLLEERKDLKPSERSHLQKKLGGLARVRAANFRRHWQKQFSPTHQRTWTNYLNR